MNQKTHSMELAFCNGIENLSATKMLDETVE